MLADASLSTAVKPPTSMTASTPYTVDDIDTNSASTSTSTSTSTSRADLKAQFLVPSEALPQWQRLQMAACDPARSLGGGTTATKELKITPTATSGSICHTTTVYGSPTLAQSAMSSVVSSSSSGGSGSPRGSSSSTASGGEGAIGIMQRRRRT